MPSTYDYEVEQQRLQQQQAMLQALQQQALTPVQMPQGGMQASRMSPLQPLAQALQAYITQKGKDKLSDEQGKLSARYRQDLASGMKSFYDTSTGGQTQTRTEVGPDGREMLFQETSKPNMKKAIFDALASNHPMVQQMAMAQLQNLNKDQLTQKDILALSGYSPQSKVAAALSRDPSKLGPEQQAQVVNNQLLTGNPYEGYKPSGDYRDQFGPVGAVANGPGGPTIGQRNTSTGEVKFAPRGTNVNVTNAAQKAGAMEYFKNAAGQVDALGKVAQTASNNLQTLSELKNLESQGIFSNATSGPATFLSNIGQIAGVPVDAAKLGNTETFNALTTDLWQGLVSKYGGNRGVTKEEAQEIKKILPLAASSPQARSQLYSILGNVSQRQISQFESANNAFAEATKADDPTIYASKVKGIYNPAPSAPSPVTQPGSANAGTAQNPLTVDQLSPQQKEMLRKMLGGQ